MCGNSHLKRGSNIDLYNTQKRLLHFLSFSEHDMIKSLYSLQQAEKIDLNNVILKPNGKFEIIDNKIVANKKGDHTTVFITHTHNKSSRKWWEKPEVLNSFIEFLQACTPEECAKLEEAIQNKQK